MSTSLQTQLPLLMTRWRQARRKFDARLLNERRLLICAVVAMIVFMFDALLITPAVKSFKMEAKRSKTALIARDTLQETLRKRQEDMTLKEAEARLEIERIQKNIERGQQALSAQKSMLAPAREMRILLDGMLAQNGRLRLVSMRTLAPEEVKFTPVSGLAISQALLYKQSMEAVVQGSFIETLTWLRSVEAMPRKLLWDGMTMKVEEGKVSLTLRVHTFSPDRDALEIVP